jgi:hypothetical protein
LVVGKIDDRVRRRAEAPRPVRDPPGSAAALADPRTGDLAQRPPDEVRGVDRVDVASAEAAVAGVEFQHAAVDVWRCDVDAQARADGFDELLRGQIHALAQRSMLGVLDGDGTDGLGERRERVHLGERDERAVRAVRDDARVARVALFEPARRVMARDVAEVLRQFGRVAALQQRRELPLATAQERPQVVARRG